MREGISTIDSPQAIAAIFADPAFSVFNEVNVLPLIYDEKKQRCNILVFNYMMACQNTCKITKSEDGYGRKHPVFKFYDAEDSYICEVRYGDAAANALQRGLWTHTRNALKYFDSVTNGWIDYSHNKILVHLFSHALVSSSSGHESALKEIKLDIERIKKGVA
jgi:hypothetical protein